MLDPYGQEQRRVTLNVESIRTYCRDGQGSPEFRSVTLRVAGTYETAVIEGHRLDWPLDSSDADRIWQFMGEQGQGQWEFSYTTHENVDGSWRLAIHGIRKVGPLVTD